MAADSIDFRIVADGILLPVQAQPGARRSAVSGLHAGRLKVAVAAPPEKGKANDELVRVLAASLDLPRRQVTLQRGEASREKQFLLTGVSIDDVRVRLNRILAPPNDSPGGPTG
ncbi:MAG: YggU family protein [Planctomyces sp.]|nr:YggU family protein [Planctomyces sp.]